MKKAAQEECSCKNRRATRQISHACCKSEEHARKLWRGRYGKFLKLHEDIKKTPPGKKYSKKN
jgi:hypothetical protein